MNYFVSKNELVEEIEKAVDAVFSAVARMFSEEDVRFNKRLKELEANFLLLINTLGYKAYQKNKKRRKNMDEERTVRPFSEILDALFDYILQSEDHELIILADELQESAKNETEKKDEVKKKLREMFKKGKAFLKEQGEEETS